MALVVNSDNFDGSENRAWNSGAPLAGLVSELSKTFQEGGQSKVRLYAHSMGNVVAAECLRQMTPASKVHTYLSAQAALSSHVWDNTTPSMPLAPQTPNVYGFYWEAAATSQPHEWPSEGRPSYMDSAIMPSGVRYINHYNPLDWALSWKWQVNQLLKPDSGFFYSDPNPVPNPRQRYWKRSGFLNLGYTDLIFPNNRFDIFAFAAGSRSFSTGQQGNTAGMFILSQSKNLNAAPFSFGSAHKGHSKQFRSSIQRLWPYWDRVIKDMNITVP
jgi:hypothetical protein